MTVEQLIRKLSKMPEDAIVTIPNNKLWIDGIYEVTAVRNYDDMVLIDTNYEHRTEDDE